MAKLSESKKVELLEAAVLEGNIEKVRSLFAEHGSFEFTARALGIACRFFGAEMVKCLIDGGASFAYTASGSMVRKYKCTYSINSRSECNLAYTYECHLVGESIGLDKEHASMQPLSAADRAGIVRMLCETREKTNVNLPEMLYHAVMNREWEIVSALKECGVVRLPNFRIAQLVSQRGATANEQHESWAFSRRLSAMDESDMLRAIRELSAAANGGRLYLANDDVIDVRWNEPDRLKGIWFTAGMFEAALECTNLLDRIQKKKWDTMYALIEKSNAAGLMWAINEGWASKAADFKKLFEHAQKFEVSPDLTALLLKYHNPEAESAKKSRKKQTDELSLDVNPLSAAELKKIWSTKKQDDGTLIITSYKGTDPDVIVPSMIGKAVVSAIHEETFSPYAPRLSAEQIAARKAIRSVEFPDTIRELPKGLFASIWQHNHDALEQVILPEGLEIIGENCFHSCASLKEIILPASLKKLGAWAFRGCSSLTEVTVPDSVTEFGAGAFSGCESLKKIHLPQHMTKLPSLSECGFEEFVVPHHIKELRDNCLSHCESLRRVVLHEGICAIPDFCFVNTALESIDLPASVTSIGQSAFEDCAKLRPFDIPETVTDLADNAFAGCTRFMNEQGMVVVRGVVHSYDGKDKGTLCIDESIRRIPEKSLKEMPPIVYRAGAKRANPLPDIASLNVGDTVELGRFPQDLTLNMQPIVWRVIDSVDGRKLLLAEKGLISLYHEDLGSKEADWSKCAVRHLLQHDFLNTAFDEEEKSCIQAVALSNKGRKDLNIPDGVDTKDTLFLLSADEVEKYFPEDSMSRAARTEYAASQYSYYGKRGVHDCWLLRTRGGSKSSNQLCVECGNGEMSMFGTLYHTAAIRPAVWVK